MAVVGFLQGLFFYAAGDRPLAFAFELVGFATGILAVFLIARERIAGWPIGVVSCVVYVFVYWDHKLYSDAILFVVFGVMQLAGWWEWLRRPSRRSGGEVVVRRLTQRAALAWLVGCFAMTIAWALAILRLFPDASLPYHDAATTVFSLAAQWLMVRRFLACWPAWMAVNVLATLNYVEKGMYPTAVLFVVYFALAIVGFVTWKKSMEAQGSVEFSAG